MELASPLRMELDGWDAADNRVEVQQLGQSLQGAGRIYKTAYHFYFTGQLVGRLRKPDVRVLISPPQEGSFSYLLWVLLAHGRLSVYPELLAAAADLCVPEMVKATLAKRAGQRQIAEQAIEKVHDIAKDNGEITRRFIDYAAKVEEGHQRDKERLFAAIDKLTENMGNVTASAITALVDPIGKSVRQLTHADKQPAEYVIDEPSAAVIRARGELEVRDITSMTVKLVAVDMLSRTCRIVTAESPKPISGKITDPAILSTENIYTRALDKGSEIVVTGKPVLKDGELITFYISDAADPARAGRKAK